MPSKTWRGGSGDWTDPVNWIGGVPARGDTVGVFSSASVADDIKVQGITLSHNAMSFIREGTAALTVEFQDTTIGRGSSITTVGEGGPVDLTLDNTRLLGSISDSFGQIDATVDAGNSFVNRGQIKAAPGIGGSRINIRDNGTFTNAGTIVAANPIIPSIKGEVAVSFGDFRTGQHTTIKNAGLIKASDGGTVNLDGSLGYIQHFGTISNTGVLDATKGGTLDINADVVQTGCGKVVADSGASVFLSGKSSGGSYQISDATLSFGNFGRFSAFPIAAVGFHSMLNLGGSSDTLSFGGAVISETLSADAHHLLISSFPYPPGLPAQVADFRLDPAANYTASQFAVHGSDVVWTAHPTV